MALTMANAGMTALERIVCGGDYRYASGTVCVSTIFAILTMPLLALLYGLF